MFDTFREYILDKSSLSEKEIDYLISFAVLKKSRRRQYILNEGDVCLFKGFIIKGAFRLFRVSEDGSEHNIRFFVEGMWLTERESFYQGVPSRYNIEAIENAEILLWLKDDFEKILSEIPAFQRLARDLLSTGYIVNKNRLYSLLNRTAEEKYLDFINFHPDLYRRIPLYMVASYLGVTRETLSRIRRNSLRKK